MNVAIEQSEQAGIPVIEIRGEFDTYTAVRVRERFQRVLVEHPEGRIIVDLSGTDYLDNTGLGTLIWFLKRVKERGGELRLAVPCQRVRSIFEITGLTKLFQVFASVAEAAH